MRFSTLGLIFTGLITGCTSNTPTTPNTVAGNVTSFYDYQ
ncbi:ChaN family lipoprotein, partial [Vibrio astriarenae]